MSEKERANFMKKSSELGTAPDLVVVHTLVCSLWGVSTIGLRIKTMLPLSFIIEGHLICSSEKSVPASMHYNEIGLYQNYSEELSYIYQPNISDMAL